MNRFYCFHCQQEIEPKRFFGFKICPLCQHRIVDSGEGFYLVCDRCGADNPVSAKLCIKCHNRLNGSGNPTSEKILYSADYLLKILANIALIIFGAAFLALVFYISFYLVIFFAALGVIYYLLSRVGTEIK